MKKTILPPPKVPKGILDRSSFSVTLNLIGLVIEASQVKLYTTTLVDDLLNLQRLRNIVDFDSKKLVLLGRHVKTKTLQELKPQNRLFIQEKQPMIVEHSLLVGYDYWTADEVFKQVLPDNVSVSGSHETIGHIAHLNLRDEALPFKKLIGQVLLDVPISLILEITCA